MSEIAGKILVGGIKGSSGKTVVSLGLVAVWRRQGRRVLPFKKGPDFVDAAWLARAARVPCYTLDSYLMGAEGVVSSFARRQVEGGISVIEGNRGLFDGMDTSGTYSTAELAKLLKAPVVIALDATKITRTAAAMVLGIKQMDPEVDLRGVILNRVAGARHESILRSTIEDTCGMPVIGAIPRLEDHLFPERHLGLVMPEEHPMTAAIIDRTADAIETYVDMDAILNIAKSYSSSMDVGAQLAAPNTGRASSAPTETVRIGVVRDGAFSFYYPENLEQLIAEGATLVEINALENPALPDIDALYIGGGFPETHARLLANNAPFRNSVRKAVESGLPVWAECGGAMFMGEEISYGGETFPMVGALPIRFGFSKRPRGHGYTLLEVDEPNPYFEVGTTLRAHEFHYSYVLEDLGLKTVFKCRRGNGFDGSRDGVSYKNLIAVYSHLNDLDGNTGWAGAMVDAAGRWAGHEKVLNKKDSEPRLALPEDRQDRL